MVVEVSHTLMWKTYYVQERATGVLKYALRSKHEYSEEVNIYTEFYHHLPLLL